MEYRGIFKGASVVSLEIISLVVVACNRLWPLLNAGSFHRPNPSARMTCNGIESSKTHGVLGPKGTFIHKVTQLSSCILRISKAIPVRAFPDLPVGSKPPDVALLGILWLVASALVTEAYQYCNPILVQGYVIQLVNHGSTVMRDSVDESRITVCEGVFGRRCRVSCLSWTKRWILDVSWCLYTIKYIYIYSFLHTYIHTYT